MTNFSALVSWALGEVLTLNLLPPPFVSKAVINLVKKEISYNFYRIQQRFQVLQIIATNYFLNGRFLYYGYNLITNTNPGYSPMVEVFPKLTKCTYFKYGSSGSMESRDALCVLPLNVVNEKLYTFLWVWFYLLTILSAYNLLQRAVMLASKCFRVYVLTAQTRYVLQKLKKSTPAKLEINVGKGQKTLRSN